MHQVVSELLKLDSPSTQLQLLLQYLRDDPRQAVKRLAINDLKLLAKKAPHLWIRENTQVQYAAVPDASLCRVRVNLCVCVI